MKGTGASDAGQPAGPATATPTVAETIPSTTELSPLFPQLEILERLGQGGMGVVYKARQPHLDRFVALKILSPQIAHDPAFAQRFAREARALARLNHPNIVAIYDFGQVQDLYYLILEFVDGVNLGQMEHANRLTPEQALQIVPRICEALQYAHEEGIVHRDIKPGNILIDKKGRVKIADFGLAKLVGGYPGEPALTDTGKVMGTPRYMAPEQFQRPQAVDHRADIYSLGVVFYEMLTGEVPMGRFPPPSQKVQVDVRLDQVVLKALEQEPERRYQHVSEVKTEVDTILQQTALKPPFYSKKVGLPPRSFWPMAFGLFLAGWLVTAVLSNLRLAGCLAAAVVMAVLLVAVGLSRMKLFPEQAICWTRISVGQRAASLALILLLAAAGFLMVESGFYDYWERAGLRRNFQARTDHEFEAAYNGKEYQLIRGLTAFRQQVPTVELIPRGGRWVGGWLMWGPSGPHHRLSSRWSLWLGFFALLGSAHSIIGGWRVPGTRPRIPFSWAHTRAAAALFAAILGSAFLFYNILAALYLFSGYRPSETKTWICAVPIDQVTANLESWFHQNGFATGDEYNWIVQTVPRGDKVGEVRLREAWKPWPFERWQFGWHGFERISPWLALELVASDKPAETMVQITSTQERLVPKTPENLSALIDRLASTTRATGAN